MTLTELAEKHGESIDNLPMDILMEAIYNERNAYAAGVLHHNKSEEKKTEAILEEQKIEDIAKPNPSEEKKAKSNETNDKVSKK